MVRLIGRLQWMARLVSASSQFFAGAYRTMLARSKLLSSSITRATATRFIFAIPSHTQQQPTTQRRFTMFSDTAQAGMRYWAGVVGRPGVYRSVLCPKWVSTLQRAEMYAAYYTIKCAVYCSWGAANLGVDNDTARL